MCFHKRDFFVPHSVLRDLLTPHAATLTVSPDKSQFFKYDYIPLKCLVNSSGWEVKRMVKNTLQTCEHGWGIPEESSCTIVDAFPADTGTYWCESQGGERSDTVNITVIGNDHAASSFSACRYIYKKEYCVKLKFICIAAHGMILESPLRPVLEGDDVTLRCSFKIKGDENVMTDFPTSFFKNGEFIGVEELGRMTLRSVSKSYDEGFYKCKHGSNGESKESWLEVRGEELLVCLKEAVITGAFTKLAQYEGFSKAAPNWDLLYPCRKMCIQCIMCP